MLKSVFQFIIVAMIISIQVGCASMFGGGDDTKASKKVAAKSEPMLGPNGEPLVRFSDSPSVLNTANRQYRKMNRARMEEESEVNAQAGSMWVMEGQGAYLFTQNKSRREGDLLNVQVEGPGQRQVETKVSVIKKLLKQLEEEDLKRNQPPQDVQMQMADGGKPGGPDDAKNPAARAPASVPKAEKPEKEEPLTLDVVPTRIVERMNDGNYRVKGQQPFMIGKREYKVIVTGIVRPEDFNDQTAIGSNKLLDPQFDVVSLRRSNQ